VPEARVRQRKPVGTKSVPSKPTEKKGHSITTTPPGTAKFLKVLLFGPPKTFKTTLACSGQGKILLISLDPDGDLVGTIQGRKNIEVVRPKTIAEVKEIVKALRTTDKDRFDWVVLDSTTFLFQIAAGSEINTAYEANQDVRRPYGKAGAAVVGIINGLVSLDINLVITAHLKVDQGDESEVTETQLGEHGVKVAVSPMVWSVLGPAVSMIGRTYKQQVYGEKVNGKRNKETKYFVSFDDGDKSPVGSRISMDALLDGELDMLAKLHAQLIGE